MAQTADELQDALSVSATEPQSVTTDAGSVSMPSLFNQIELLKFLRNQEAQAAGRDLPKFRKINNPNARGY